MRNAELYLKGARAITLCSRLQHSCPTYGIKVGKTRLINRFTVENNTANFQMITCRVSDDTRFTALK